MKYHLIIDDTIATPPTRGWRNTKGLYLNDMLGTYLKEAYTLSLKAWFRIDTVR